MDVIVKLPRTDNGLHCGPKLHDYIRELSKDKGDIITVGETWGISRTCKAIQQQIISMVFQFEHIGLTSRRKSKWV